MKTLILSDIHSNIFALEAIWAQEKDCDLVYCAGDLVDYGPHPREVIQWIQAHDVSCVKGNHDQWVIVNYRQGKTLATLPADECAWVHHNAGLLTEEDVLYLEQLPESIRFGLDGVEYGMTHLYQEYDEIVSRHAFAEFRDKLCAGEGDTAVTRIIFGHTHRQAVRYLADDWLWLNPGSVSYRRRDDPDQTAHYATIIDGRLSLRQVEYDLAPLRRLVRGVTLMESEMRLAERFFGSRSSTAA